MPKLTLELRRKSGGKLFVLVAPDRQIIQWYSDVPKAYRLEYDHQVFVIHAGLFQQALEDQRVQVLPQYNMFSYGDFYDVSEQTLLERLKAKYVTAWAKFRKFLSGLAL